MANRVQQDRVQLTVEVNGKQVANTLKDIQTQYRRMIQLRNSAEIGGKEFKEYNDEAARLKAILDEQRNSFKQAEAGASSFFGTFGKGLGVFAAIGGAGVLVDIGKQFLGIATQLDQLDQKAATVFGDAITIVEQFADRNATAMGLTRDEYIATATAAGDLLIPMGFQREEAANLSNDLIGLSGALAEWTGGQRDSEEVSQILTKALLGEREELKSLGISISEADVQTRLAAKGQKEYTGNALEQAKALATLELITEKSADAQAAYAANTGNLVRQQAELSAKIGEIRDRIARALIPAFSTVLGFLNDLTGGTRAYSDELEKERVELNVLVARIGRYNEGNEDRKKLIDQLNQQYPGFLENLDAETATNAELRDRLKEVNQQYVNRIILQKEEEQIQKAAEKLAENQRRALEKDIEIEETLLGIQEKYNVELEKGISREEEIRATVRAVREANRSREFGQRDKASESFLTSLLQTYSNALDDVAESEQLLNDLQNRRDEIAKRLGVTINDTPVTPDPDPVEPDTPDPELTEEEKKRLAKLAQQRREIAEKNERDLARYIEDLRVELIDDDLQRRLEQIDLAAEREIEALQGTEEQKAIAIELINQRRRRQTLQALEDDAEAQQAIRDRQADKEKAAAEKAQQDALKELDDYHRQRMAEITQAVLAEAQAGNFEDRESAEKSIQERMLAELRDYLERRIALLRAYGVDVSDLEKELAELDLDKIFKKKEGEGDPGLDWLEKLITIAEIAGQVINQLFDLQTARAKAAYDEQLDALDQAKEKELKRFQNDARKKEEIEAKFQQKREELDLQYKKKEKARAITQSIINTALAAVTALGTPPAPNVPAAILAGVLGGIQTAVIAAQEYAKGGYRLDAVSDSPAGPVNKPTLFIAGEEGPEWIAPNWMLNHPEYGPTIRSLEGARVRGFADGGFNATPPPAPSDNAVAMAGLDKQDMQIRLLQQLLTATQTQKVATVVTEKDAIDIYDLQQDVQVRRTGTALG